jgi:hypothetical protein
LPMSWFTLSWAIFLNGVLISTASGSMGLNFKKNGVINMGLTGLMYLGGTFSVVSTQIFSLNPYWGVLVSVLVGGLVNLALNFGYLDLLRRYKDPRIVSLMSLVSFGALYLVGRGLYLYLLGGSSLLTVGLLRDMDFTLFSVPGVIILGTSALILSVVLRFVLSPVIDSGPRGFDKWDISVYALSGATVCFVGALYPFWFPLSWQILLIAPVAGVFVGGLEKKINPFLGGLFTAMIYVWFTSLGQDVLGPWLTGNLYLVPLALLLVSIPLFPRGLVGSFRRVVEHGY